jgi:DNA-nicking Smr family endonuclease
LWAEVARTLKPLGKRARKTEVAAKASIKKAEKPSAPVVARPMIAVVRPERAGPPALSGFDRRTSQRLMRGQAEIDARIDLHGTGVELARHRLLSFLGQSRSAGHRMVLVITGKGASPFARHTLHGAEHFHTPEREGRLRRLLTEWLHEPEFRALVSGFQPAHPKHGGGGAFYVKLRRIRP